MRRFTRANWWMCSSGNNEARPLPVNTNTFFSAVHRRGAGLGLLAALAALAGGCTVGPDYVRPVVSATEHYTSEAQAAATVTAEGRSQAFIAGAAVPADWWRRFGSAQLDAVVRQAITNNPTLQAAEASLRESQDSLHAGYGVYYPHLEANLGASRERVASTQNGGQTPGRIFNLITASGTISYALDVFGGARRTVESLRAQADYQRYEREAAWLALTANVVNTCIARAAYAGQIQATEELIGLEAEQLDLLGAQVRAGTLDYASLLSQRSLIAANRALLAPLAQEVGRAEHLLATLEGVAPALAVWPDFDLTGLVLPADLPLSLPSELIHQRPDILAAEAQMAAASAKIGVATAAMYPSFNISGTYGTAGSSFGNLSALAAASGQFWSIGPAVTMPVFQGTSLWYGRKAAQEASRQAQAVYRETVLAAFAQVADALTALQHDAEGLQAQTAARTAATEALALVRVNYRAGRVGYAEVLTADGQFHQATVAWLQAVGQRQQDTVGLFAALGGGWWNRDAEAGKGGGR